MMTAIESLDAVFAAFEDARQCRFTLTAARATLSHTTRDHMFRDVRETNLSLAEHNYAAALERYAAALETYDLARNRERRSQPHPV